MKKPLIIVMAIVLGILATNSLISKKNVSADVTVEDKIETSQAASIPL